MSISLRNGLTLMLVSLMLPGSVFGRGRAPLKPRPPFKPPYSVISAVDPAAQTITVGHVNSTDTTTKTIKVDKSTEIQVNGQKGTFADIKSGMKVAVTPGFSEAVASRLVLSPPPAEPPAK